MARTKEEKEAIVQSFLSQSISKAAFCKENNISQPTLNRFLKQLNTRVENTEKSDAQFMKITLPTTVSPELAVESGVHLELNGMTLHFPQNISATFIGEVLKVVMSHNV